MKTIKCIKLNKKIIAVLLVITTLIITTFCFYINKKSKNINTYPYNLTVVLDAGHGGEDGGAVGVTTGKTENELNLSYALKIEKYLKAFGVNVVQTRTTLKGLYDVFNQDFKQQDMEKRKQIINNSKANLVVSIHMNKFTNSSSNGAQVFYGPNNENSHDLANSIRDEMVKNFNNARELTLEGDYYITNCSNIPTVIVECGFLSNEQEELNLINEDYQNKMCYSIFCGIARYLLINYN